MAIGNNNEIEKKLWAAADQLRANSQLSSQEYSAPVLGLIFLRYADHKFTEAEKKITKKLPAVSRRKIGKADYQAKGVMYLPDEARYSHLLNLPEGKNIGKAVNNAMKAIESENDEIKGVLPQTYTRFEKDTLIALLKQFSNIPMDIEGDVFGKIYEYFLGKFAMSEGKKGGEFFTPTSIVKLIVDVIEPFHGRIYDPACGSGGMFVQSAKFVERHKKRPSAEISIFGEEKTAETIRLCKMNLAVHGLSGDIKQGNTYYDDIHNSIGKFDFVMANPPFNVNGVDKEKLKDDKRFPYGLPKPDNANYIWIQIFLSALNDKGRAGFVMANSASDARQSELEIRQKMIEDNHVDVMTSIGSNFFYTVTLPCTLWFLDKGKAKLPPSPPSPLPMGEGGLRSGEGLPAKGARYRDTVLFIDARHIFRQIDRAHRDFLPEQIEFISNIVRLYRDKDIETDAGSEKLMKEHFPKGKYRDIDGLCKVATLKDIKGHGYSLNPGRYVGVAQKSEDDGDFYERLEGSNKELERLNTEARDLEERIADNVAKLLEQSG
ncbi:MAG: SAM-dependent DNA methyltransferase [Nitrospirae bacterium]|nr:SAM-dependent DNA methyltransferase [Nitrospirota bacterium]